MKMYPDLTVEGTPEEIAAFKHIDAALAHRNGHRPQRAIEGPKKAPKKVASTRVYRKGGDVREQILRLVGAKDGISTNEIAEYLEMSRKTTYNYLYSMVAKGEIVRDGKLYHRVPARVHD